MLNRLYSWYGKKVVLSVVAIIVLLIGAAVFLLVSKSKPEVVEVQVQKTTVTVSQVKNIVFASSFSTVGVVESVSEATLQTEAGGRVTSVPVEIGNSVRSGTVLATLENSAQQAQLLQAEGAYEAAVASAAASEVGVEGSEEALASAYTSGINTFQNTYITIDGILHNDIDDLFVTSNGVATGFKLDGKGRAPALNTERTELESILKTWATNKNIAHKSNIESFLKVARENTLRTALFAEELSNIVANQDTSDSFTDAQKNVLEATLTGARSALNSSLQTLERTSSGIDAAKKAYEQAQLTGSTNVSSASSAQVKIALGSLRAAQSNYQKTIVRTPIAGVVNALYLKTGDYVSPSQPAAIVANNNGLQILTGVSEDDSSKLAVGDEVRIDGVATGTITALGGATDPTTGKVAVKVSVNEEGSLQNGSTVSLTFILEDTDESLQELVVPLSSFKMTAAGPIAFTVSAENTLVPVPVVLGKITGDSVVVESGITLDTSIVIDARGLKEGQEVDVTIK